MWLFSKNKSKNNNNIVIIRKYDCIKDYKGLVALTKCPYKKSDYGEFHPYISSIGCRECENFIAFNDKKQYVICKCDNSNLELEKT